MIDLSQISHHPVMEEITSVLCAKTQNSDKSFFHAEVAYFLSKIAGSMRATVHTKDRGEIPINMYAICLATSGYGKGHSINIMEDSFLKGFRTRFMEETLSVISEKTLWDIANSRAVRKNTDPQDEYDGAKVEWNNAGKPAFTFDSGTVPAIKQLRHRLLLSGCGSINYQVDEIGLNLESSTEMLTAFLELYDQGKIKQKLTKNTSENIRGEEIDGKTPANMLLFGTPSKLFDGSSVEDKFYSMLDTGYARRCLFGIGVRNKESLSSKSATELYTLLTNPSNDSIIHKWASHFTVLADPINYAFSIQVPDNVAIELLEYKLQCEKIADSFPEHEEIKKAEMSHRYFKVLKLAGSYAFIDQTNQMTMMQLHQAMLLVEESGKCFQTVLNREKAYVKLAKYISSVDSELTHADLHESLPYYKSTPSARNELIAMATAWGYKRHIIIKKSFIDGIEFFKGESLKETNLNEIIISYSDHFAHHYEPEKISFKEFNLLALEPGMNWCNHHFINNHRTGDTVIPGFNTIVLDIDEGTSLSFIHEILKEYTFVTYTTKRHQQVEGNDRFRLIIPINYILELDAEEYKAFYTSFLAWLPFTVDVSANQRERKWSSNSIAEYHYNEGIVLDALPFIPKTKKNEEYTQSLQEIKSLDNLERWFASRMSSGNRNNNMLKFALAIVDSGCDLLSVTKKVKEFNAKIADPLPETELQATVLRTVAKQYMK